MTEAEELRSETRELKMRLREVRTENAELKLQQKRWLILSSIVSGLSLFLAFLMFFASGDIKVEKTYPSNHQPTVYPLDPVEVPAPVVVSEPEPPKPVKPKDTFLDAPELDFGLEPKTTEPKVVNKEPSRGGDFALPGMESQSKKKVTQYVVRKNDTLWSIAKKMMGSSKSSNINKIMKDNGLTDSRLDPGMSLVIITDR